MDAIGIRITFIKNKWPELNKMTEAGQMMMWGLGWISGIPDGDPFYSYLVSRNIGTSNDARLRLPEYDRLYEQAHALPDGPATERDLPQAQRHHRQLRPVDPGRLPVSQRPDAAVAARVQGERVPAVAMGLLRCQRPLTCDSRVGRTRTPMRVTRRQRRAQRPSNVAARARHGGAAAGAPGAGEPRRVCE